MTSLVPSPDEHSRRLLVAMTVLRSKPASTSLKDFIHMIRQKILSTDGTVPLASNLSSTAPIHEAVQKLPSGPQNIPEAATHMQERKESQVSSKLVLDPATVRRASQRIFQQDTPCSALGVAGNKSNIPEFQWNSQDNTCNAAEMQDVVFPNGLSKNYLELQTLVFSGYPIIEDLSSTTGRLCMDLKNMIDLLTEALLATQGTNKGTASSLTTPGQQTNDMIKSYQRVMNCAVMHIAVAVSRFEGSVAYRISQAKVVYHATSLFEHLLSAAASIAKPFMRMTRNIMCNHNAEVSGMVGENGSDRDCQESANGQGCFEIARTFVSFYHNLASLDGRAEHSIRDAALELLVRDCTKVLNELFFGYGSNRGMVSSNDYHQICDYAESLLFMLESILTMEAIRITRVQYSGSGIGTKVTQNCRDTVDYAKHSLHTVVTTLLPWVSGDKGDDIVLQTRSLDNQPQQKQHQKLDEVARKYLFELQRVLKILPPSDET